jgi:hypothetical protein
VPGFAALTPESRNKLDAVAGMLQQKTELKVNIRGRVDPGVDRAGLRDAAVMHAIQEEKVKHGGGKTQDTDLDSVEITPDEYDKYIERAYKDAKFAKPHNFIGLNKSLLPDDMKKLMKINAQVTDSDLPRLADARAAVVRKYLSAKIDAPWLFVTAPMLDAKGIQGKGKTTRVDLSLE